MSIKIRSAILATTIFSVFLAGCGAKDSLFGDEKSQASGIDGQVDNIALS